MSESILYSSRDNGPLKGQSWTKKGQTRTALWVTY